MGGPDKLSVQVTPIENYLDYDWNWLIVLDAFRWDVFHEMYECGLLEAEGLRGKVYPVSSGATRTVEWYRKHWSEKTDVHLITASPQPGKPIGGKGSSPIMTRFKSYEWAWFSESRRERPNPDLTMWFGDQSQHPGERHLLHLVPPHLPFIGPLGMKITKKLGARACGMAARYLKFREFGRAGNWEMLKEAYAENALIGVRAVAKGLDRLKGKVVITSDHAELIGEEAQPDDGGFYGHPSEKDVSGKAAALLKLVPWMEVDRV